MEIAKNYFPERQILNSVMYRYTLYQKKKDEIRMSFFRNFGFFVSQVFVIFNDAKRMTDVAGFEIRHDRKYIRKRKQNKEKC